MTAIPDAKLALAAMLASRPGLAGVLVRAGLPAAMPVENDRIYVDASVGESFAVPEDHDPGTEAFAIQVVVETRQLTGDDPAGYAAAEARKWILFRELEATVRSDRQLGVAVWGSWVVVTAEVTRPTVDGWFGQVLAAVHCRNVAA